VIAEIEFDKSLPSCPLLAVFVEWICNCALFIQCCLLSLPDSCQNKNICTAAISERNDNNMRTTSWKREHIYSAVISDFVCLYNYEFWLSLCKIFRSSVILLLPLFTPFFKRICYTVKCYYYKQKIWNGSHW
jgi:hypothetical protein